MKENEQFSRAKMIMTRVVREKIPQAERWSVPKNFSDPFPGGHEYFCVISGKRLGKYFDFVPIGRSERVNEEDARKFFLAIRLAWTQNAEEAKSGLEYFLNSVEEIDFDGERLKFCEVCSPVVRG